jgi:hypothetical protein
MQHTNCTCPICCPEKVYIMPSSISPGTSAPSTSEPWTENPSTVSPGIIPFPYEPMRTTHEGHLKGWECPKCSAVFAPFIPQCTNCGPKT